MSWICKIAPGYGPEGEPVLSVLAKRTYGFGPGTVCQPLSASDSIPFHEVDSFYDDNHPLKNAPKHENDLVAYKPLVDILLHACAEAPRGRSAHFLDVGLMVGNYTKKARVFGDRKVQARASGYIITDPQPFESMRLDYSRAFGGIDKKSEAGQELPYLKNPVGKGFAIKSIPENLHQLDLPNLEEIEKPITLADLVATKFENWIKMPEPVAFGIVPRNSYPRYLLAGLPRQEYEATKASRKADLESMPEVGTPDSAPPPPPQLLDARFFNCASPGLAVPYLKGDETFKLRNMDMNHPIFEFRLMGEKPALWLDVGDGRQYLESALQTVEVFKPTHQVTLLWRGMARYGGPEAMKKFTRFEFGVDDG